MKILSNATYQAMLDQIKYMSESNVKLNCDIERLKSELETLQQERLRLNLTRDEKGVLHRISETKMSRINRKAKAGKESENEAKNDPKPKKFEPKEGEIVSVTVEGGSCGIVYFKGIGKDHYGINFAGEFSNCFGINKGDIISPATKSQKVKLSKLDPQSEYNLHKMINSKSPKELATEYLGLKVGDGEICGYDNKSIILGYDSEFGWHESSYKDVVLLKKCRTHWRNDIRAKQAILKSLNPR